MQSSNPLHDAKLFRIFFFLFLASAVVAEIRKERIVDDLRPAIVFEQFGFLPGGRIDVSVNSASWSKPAIVGGDGSGEIDPALMGFFLIRGALFPKIINESEYSPSFCPLSSRFARPLFTFNAIINRAGNASVTVDDPDEYSLLFGNCNPLAAVNMDVRTEMYNIVGENRDYLPAGMAPVPTVYFVFFLAYVAFLGTWAVVCLKRRESAGWIHAVMAALLLFKALKMVCAAEDLWHVKVTGTAHGWDVPFYIFGFFKGILLFTVIALVGTGWSFLKPYLQEREKDVLKIVIPLQVIENIAVVIIGETGPAEKSWLTWNQIFLLVDIICCAAVFCPIIWSIRSLREASKTDGKAARNLQKLNLFKQFYVVLVCYLYFTRIVVSAFSAVLYYKYRWLVTVAMEGASLAFYVFMFHNFQPIERNPYLYVGDDEEASAAQALEMDSFEL